MAESYWYPSVEDVLTIYDDIVSEYPDTTAGVQNRGDREFALNYIEEGRLEQYRRPSTRRRSISFGC